MAKIKRSYTSCSILCNLCHVSLEWELNKKIARIYIKNGRTGIKSRKEWGSVDEFYLCQQCYKRLLKKLSVIDE